MARSEQYYLVSNRNIAKMLDWEWKEHPWNQWYKNGLSVGKDQELKFHESWDWLMPVVEFINSQGYDVVIAPHQTQIFEKYRDMIIDADFSNDIKENTHDAVAAFAEIFLKKKGI